MVPAMVDFARGGLLRLDRQEKLDLDPMPSGAIDQLDAAVLTSTSYLATRQRTRRDGGFNEWCPWLLG